MKNRASLESALKLLALVLAVAIVGLGLAYSIQGAPPLPTDALAASPKAVPESAPARVAAPIEVGRPDEALAPATIASEAASAVARTSTAVLFGTVARGDGKPVVGFVALRCDGEFVGSVRITDDKRAFAFAGLSPGTYTLTTRLDEALPTDRVVEVTAPQTRVDIVIEAQWTLTVHALAPDGSPLAAAIRKQLPMFGIVSRFDVVALLEPLTRDLPPHLSNTGSLGLGVFRGTTGFGNNVLPKTAVGVLTLPEDRPVHVALLFGGSLVAQQAISPGDKELTFRVAPEAVLQKLATLRLRLVDESGQPVEGARVNVGNSFDPKAITDRDGRIEFSNLEPGQLGFRVLANKRSPPIRIIVAAGAKIDLGDVVVQSAVGFELSFEGFEREDRVDFHLLDKSPNAQQRFDYVSVVADGGKRQPIQLYPGRYAAIARSKNGVAVRTIDTSAVAGQVLSFELSAGANVRIQGDLLLPLDVALRTSDGYPVFRRSVSGKPAYSFRVPIGDYAVSIGHCDGRVTHRTLHVGAQGATLALP